VSMEHAAVVVDDAGGYYALLRKERIFCDGQLVVRIDNRSRVTRYTREMVGHGLRSYLSHCSPELVVMADYDGGALYGEGRSDDGNLQVLLSMRDRLLVDTKLTDLSVFDGTLLAKLNEREWEAVIRTEATPERFFSFLVVTHGAAGAELIMRRSTGPKSSTTHSLRTKACPVEAVDVCGCGDTFLAGLAAMMLRNPDPFTALQFANAAASTVVSRPRTEIADRDMTLRIVGRTDEARG
jgi:bifunctional ADP-heptose synthase (sugar kinase/adenylyltransferase)